jgi:uncharacterized membrane protein YfcA
MPFSLTAILLAPLVSLFASTVLAISGFGSALISIPLLALLLPLQIVVPLVLVLDFCASLVLGIRLRGSVDRTEALRVVPAMLVGIPAGVLLLVLVPARVMLLALGTFVLTYGIYTLTRRGGPPRLSQRWAVPAGVAGGLLGGAVGVGGPIYVMYYSARIAEPARLRATLSLTFLISTGTRLTLFAVSGLLVQKQLGLAFALLLPAVLTGLFLGHHIGQRLPHTVVMRAVAALLIASGLSVLWKAATL